MPVKVKCSNCDKSLMVPDAARGKAVKCPQCQTRIPVPAEDDSAKTAVTSKSTKSKPKVKKPVEPADSESVITTLDLRKAIDTEARICPKCGHDMKYQEEDDNECPKCGYDSNLGGMGAKARKRSMRGPDPADFYPGLVKEAWTFVGKNITLAARTIMYTLVCGFFASLCVFLYLYLSMWPPRIFLTFCFLISFFVIPGWMWVFDTEVIKLTLERKDKFKKLRFDFFLSSAMGAAFACACVAIALPLMILPAGLGYALVNFGGMPNYVLAICIGIGLIPAIWVLPVVMSHMAMPVPQKGWMVWKVVPMWAKNIKPLSVWLLWFLLTNIPNVAGIVTIGAVYGSDLVQIVEAMEFNAKVNREEFNRIQNPNTAKKGQVPKTLAKLPDRKPVDFKPVIVPAIILVVMSIINGFTCMFNMRINGQFTYYHKGSLELVDKVKEYKYIAKEVIDEDAPDKPKTTVQHAVDAITLVMVFCIIGLVGGMLYGSMTEAGPLKGIVLGMLIGSNLANLTVWGNGLKAGFGNSPLWGCLNLFFYPIANIVFASKNWQDRQPILFQSIFAPVVYFILLICAILFDALPSMGSKPEIAPAPAPAQALDPSQMAVPGGAPAGQSSAPPGLPAVPAVPPGK